MPSSIFVVPFINNNPVIDLSAFAQQDGIWWSCCGQVGKVSGGDLPTCIIRITLASTDDIDTFAETPDVKFLADCAEDDAAIEQPQALSRSARAKTSEKAKKRERETSPKLRVWLKQRGHNPAKVDDECGDVKNAVVGIRRLHKVTKLELLAAGLDDGGLSDD